MDSDHRRARGVDSLIEAFVGNPESDYAMTTRASYRWALTRFAAWCGENDIKIGEVTAAQLRVWLRGAKSRNYQRLLGNAVRSFLRWLGGDDQAAAIRLPTDDAPAGRTLTDEQLQRLVASFDTSTAEGWRNVAIVMLAADTGLRSAELCRLETRHLDLINRGFDVIQKGGNWRLGKYTIETAHALETWMGLRRGIARRKVVTVFVSIAGSRPGTSLTTGGLRALFRTWGRNAGLGPLSPHDLRRTMAVLYSDNGAPDRLIMEAGGWKDVRTLHRYQRAYRLKNIDRYAPTKGMFTWTEAEKPEDVGLKQNHPAVVPGEDT